MSPAAAFHAQLASIMEVLANTAVAEICELVDSGYSVLQLEISRSRKENEVLRRKLRLMELRAARAAALRAAAAASGATPPHASARARAQLSAHHPGNEPRRNRAPAGEAAPSSAAPSSAAPQESPRRGGPEPPSDSGQETRQVMPAAGESDHLTTAVIKVEEDDESWSQSEQHEEAGAPPPPPPTKQETEDEGGDSSRPWTCGEVSSTSSQRPEAGSYECLMCEPQPQPQPQHRSPLGEEPGCSYAPGGGFPFDAGTSAASNEPPHPGRKEGSEGRSALTRGDGWRHRGGADRGTASHSRDDGGGGGGGGGRAFVCNCCGKTLACLKNLKTHMRVHTGEKPFVCALCAKRFSDSSNLKRHQSVHTGEKRYGCVHCGKRFAQSGSLKVHMTVHTDCKQFRCSFCGKTFISGGHLRRHITVHGGEKRFTPAAQ